MNEGETPEEVSADERMFVADWFPQSAFRMCFVPIEPEDRSSEPTEPPIDPPTEMKN